MHIKSLKHISLKREKRGYICIYRDDKMYSFVKYLDSVITMHLTYTYKQIVSSIKMWTSFYKICAKGTCKTQRYDDCV